MLRFFRYWLPVLLWMILIFGMSTGLGSAENTSRFIEPFLRWLIPDITPARLQQVHFYIRKAAHLTEYAILGLLLWRALRQTRLGNTARAQWKIAAAVLLIAAA